MRGERAGQRFDQFIASPLDELFRLVTNGGVVHRDGNIVLQISRSLPRPKSEIESEALRAGAFFVGDADMRLDFQPLNLNAVVLVHAIRSVWRESGHDLFEPRLPAKWIP